MKREIALGACLLLLTVIWGCEEKQKPDSLVNALKQKQAGELEYSIAGTCEGCDRVWDLEMSPRDIAIARNPGIDNQQLYLTVVDKAGNPMMCCKKPMRIVVENDGKLALYCPECGKFKPIAIKDGKVVVE